MQIHELNTFSGTPGNTDYLAIDDGSDTSKISSTRLLSGVNARVDNLIDCQTPAVTNLWTGFIDKKNQTANLSQNISNFDFIDIYIADFAMEYIRRPVSSTMSVNIECQNMADDIGSQFIHWFETGLTISGTTATINRAIKCYWDDFSAAPVVSEATAGGCVITRIDGIKVAQTANAEIVDARVGADGVTYPTLGGAIRTQVTDLKDDIEDIEDAVTETETINIPVSLTISAGYYDYTSHALVWTDDSSRQSAIVTGVSEGEQYILSTSIGSTRIPAILYLTDNYVNSEELRGNGTPTDYPNYSITIPSGCNKIVVQSAYPSRVSLALKKVTTEIVAKAYSKSETDSLISAVTTKVYGLKWDEDDPDDLGARCFDAVGLSATIGVGSTDGSSDFDDIYPWSGMKRCNIKVNANGARIVTFEGESGFALDGTNGDVFVRIPKFYIKKYAEDGYRYITISSSGETVHPAFVENGEVLDEIFVSAFEGYSDGTKLHSISAQIPTSNITPDAFLTLATANGNGYSLYDMRTADALWMLMAVEFGNRNSNRILGYGFADFRQPDSTETMMIREVATSTNSVKTNYSATTAVLMPIGSNITICKETQNNIIAQRKITNVTNDGTYMTFTFDGDPIDVDLTCFCGSAGCTTNFCESVPTGALSWHTGRANWISGSNTRNPIRYRWIENIVGSLWSFLPDVTFNNLQMYVCKNISDYEFFNYDGNKYVPIGDTFVENTDNGNKGDVTGANYWITELADEIFAKAVDFGRAYDKSLLSTQAFGAYYYLRTGTRCIANGGGFDHLYRCNMLTNRAWIGSTDRWYLYGARLMYKNI